LSAFVHFFDRKWVDSNPAINLRAPKVAHRPTLPFTREEMLKILAALDKYSDKAGLANAQRLRAFVLTLRYSGLRIGDAVQCGPERFKDDKLFLYTQKTGVPVYCILPDFVVRAIEAAPRTSEKFFFWTGKSTLHTAVGIFQRSLQNPFYGWPTSNAATRTGSAILSLLSSSSLVYHSNVFQSCSAIKACESLSATTHPGFVRGRSSWSRI
jgi:integrase